MKVKSMSAGSYRSFRFELILRTYKAIGVLLALSAAIFLFLKKSGIYFDSEDRIALTAFAVGSFTATLSWVVADFYKVRDIQIRKSEEDRAIAYKLISAWAHFEKLAIKKVAPNADPGSRISTRQLLDSLLTKGIISNREYSDLEFALTLRNEAAHAKIDSFEISEIEEVIRLINDNIDKLSAS